MSSLIPQARITLHIPLLVKHFFNIRWLTCRRRLPGDFFRLHVKGNVLHRMSLVLKRLCKVVRQLNGERPCKENMMRSLEMVSGSLLIDQRINMYWKQSGLLRENAILTATSRGTRLAGLLGALSNVKGLTILKPLLPQTNKALFAMTAKKQLHFHQVDMITAFLNSRLGEKVYIEQPLHFHNGNES